MALAPTVAVLLPLLAPPALSSDGTPDHLREGLSLLHQGVAQQGEIELWTDVIPTTRMAKAALARSGSDPSVALAAYATADAVAGWQQLLMAANLGGTTVDAVESDGPSVADVVDTLQAAEGTLPVTSRVLVNVLFEIQDYDAAADALLRGFVRFDDDVGLNEVAQMWADFHPAPESVVDLIDKRIAARAEEGAIDASLAALHQRTRATFRQVQATRVFGTNDLPAAATLYQDAARGFGRADVLDPSLDSMVLAAEQAAAWNYAGWSHYYQAVNAVADEAVTLSDAQRTAGSVQTREFSVGNDVIIGHLEEAERCFLSSLRARPDDDGGALGVGYVGNFYKDNLGDDMTRTYFARVAPNSNNAAWWNNLGLLCRDTGTLAEMNGEDDEARSLYERAYRAYARCIELAPDNARWVNDTGLMLFYHLGRDFDQAERHFHHAWEQGRDVCDNPFVEQDIFDENFAAYTDAMLNLARLYQGRGEVDRALAIAEELIELAPERPDAQLTLAEIRAARGS